MIGGPSIVFTREAVVGETFMRKSSKLCKSIVGIDASKLYCYSMCQPMPPGLYTRWSTILKLRDSQLAKTNLAPLRIWFSHAFNEIGQVAKLRITSLLVDKIKTIASE